MELTITAIVLGFNLILGFAVFLNNPKRPLNIVFGLFVLSIAGWTVSNNLTDAIRSVPASLFWDRSSFAFTVLIGATLFLFSYLIGGEHGVKKSILIPLAVSAAVMFFICFTPLIVRTVELESFGSNTVNGSYFYLFFIYFIGIMLAAIANLIRRYRLVGGQPRQQMQYFFLGVTFSFLFGVTTNLILPLITGSTSLAKFGPASTIFLVFLTGFAIIRHRLLDIRLMVLKSVAYSLSLAVIAVVYIAVTYILFQPIGLAANHEIIDIFILFFLVFTFNPLRRFVEIYSDRLFFKNHYNFNKLLAKLNNIAKDNSRSAAVLTIKVMESLAGELRVQDTAFIVNSPQGVQVRSLGYYGQPKTRLKKLLKIAARAGGAIVNDELSDDSHEKAILQRYKVELLLPIKTERETLAALVLGEKKSGDPYSYQDINLLELIAPQLAIAIENAKSFKEKEQRISELNSINKMFLHIEHFLDLDKLLQEIVDEAISVTRAEGGSLMFVDKDVKALSIKTARNLNPIISLNTKVRIGEGIAGTVAKSRRPLIINGSRDPKFKPYLKREDIISALSVPMLADGKLIGVLNINRKKTKPNLPRKI